MDIPNRLPDYCTIGISEGSLIGSIQAITIDCNGNVPQNLEEMVEVSSYLLAAGSSCPFHIASSFIRMKVVR